MADTFEEFVTDPRGGGGPADPGAMPACDGGAWPAADTSDADGRQQIEFLAAYYRLNRLHRALEECRAGAAGPGAEAVLVAALHRAIEFRDRLEDRCAPVGFDAEPVMRGNQAVDLVFRYARKRVVENHRRHSEQEACVKVALPDAGLLAKVASIPGIPREEILADLNRMGCATTGAGSGPRPGGGGG
ncbi:MAG: hypothetical protein KF833_00610 [Verrucomicrobiae bacterium]|nr:hypothetical protein [Verrucomicrobiae bacterium]